MNVGMKRESGVDDVCVDANVTSYDDARLLSERIFTAAAAELWPYDHDAYIGAAGYLTRDVGWFGATEKGRTISALPEPQK